MFTNQSETYTESEAYDSASVGPIHTRSELSSDSVSAYDSASVASVASVNQPLGSSKALKKWGKTLDLVSCFPLHFFRALPLPACFTTEQSTVEASLFVNQSKAKPGRKFATTLVFLVANEKN